MVTTRRSKFTRAALWGATSLAVSAMIGLPAPAQTTISYNGGTYSQNFDTLPGSGSITFDGAGPFDLSAAPVSAGGMAGWSLAKIGGSGANAILIANAGNSTTGAAYSYGVAGETERALGALASGTNVAGFGATFINTGSTALNSFTINFTMEQWRNGGSGNPNTLSFAYGVGASDILNGTFVPASSLDAVSVINMAGGGSLNGNLPANRAARSGTVSGINWLPGQSLVIRWNDNDEVGTDSGVAVDDFSFFANTVKSLIWNPSGTGGTVWSTSPANTNWLDDGNPASFMNGDIANFTDAGVGMVQINGTVEPGVTQFSNNSGMYTAVGGSIGGNGALIKSGGGALLLDNINTYTGGTVVNSGLLLLKFDANLGAAASGVTLGGGTLQTLGTINSIRMVTLTDATTSTIDIPGSNTATFSGASGGGSLVKRGSGSLTFNGTYSVTGATSILDGTLILAQPGGAVTLNPGSLGNDFAGDLVLANGIRLNFNTGNYSGGGAIRVNATGTTLATSGSGQLPVIANNIVLNNSNLPQPFVTFLNTVFNNTLTINGVISGNADVSFALSSTGGGGGILVLGGNNTWTGSTHVNNTSGGVVRLGTHNALPQGTALVFGSGALNVGAIDLAGFNQTVASLASDTTGTINGIANTGGASVLTIAGGATTTYSGSIGIPANTAQLGGANANIALVLAPSHTGQLTLAAANSYAGGTVVGGGTLVAGDPAALGSGSLTVNAGVARLAPGLGSAVTLPAVTVTGGKFDITDNPVVIDYDGMTPLGSIRASIASAYAGGAWTGDGITSSNANASQFAVGYAEASALPSVPPIFGAVDSTAVLMRLTRYGDANLDGVVNLADFNRLAANFGTSNAVWTQGDFTYDGLVNLADFNRLAANFGLQAGPDGPTPEDWSNLASAVPEPGVAGVICLLGAGLRRRRR